VAVARFVWMVSGDDRLADIRFYEEAVTYFSDNQISVPGSNYGTRLFQPRPGLNQIEGVIARLKEDPETRRAAAVVVETGTTLGPLYNNAASMHVYEDSRARWEAAARFDPGAERRPMPAMPAEGAPDQA
jgi:thymidylate synthase